MQEAIRCQGGTILSPRPLACVLGLQQTPSSASQTQKAETESQQAEFPASYFLTTLSLPCPKLWIAPSAILCTRFRTSTRVIRRAFLRNLLMPKVSPTLPARGMHVNLHVPATTLDGGRSTLSSTKQHPGPQWPRYLWKNEGDNGSQREHKAAESRSDPVRTP